jgi:hypothetical protein
MDHESDCAYLRSQLSGAAGSVMHLTATSHPRHLQHILSRRARISPGTAHRSTPGKKCRNVGNIYTAGHRDVRYVHLSQFRIPVRIRID